MTRPEMWSLLHDASAHSVAIGVAAGLLAGWALGWFYFRQRIWVMQQRLSDYAERRNMLDSIEGNRLVCPVCKSRSLHRSSVRSFGVAVGMAFRRYPYRCERCFSISMHRGQTSYALGAKVDTQENLKTERKQFEVELQVARKMKRLYPEMFRADVVRAEPRTR